MDHVGKELGCGAAVFERSLVEDEPQDSINRHGAKHSPLLDALPAVNSDFDLQHKSGIFTNFNLHHLRF